MGALHGLPALVKALQVCRPELFPAFPALRLTGTPSEPTTHASTQKLKFWPHCDL